MIQRFTLFGITALTGLFLGSVLHSSHANALVELKAGYSQFTSAPTGLNDQFPLSPKIEQMQGLSVDIMGKVPLMPVGLGVRYEMFKRNESNGTGTSQLDWKRTSILVNKRFIDTLVYLGPIATISFASDFKYQTTIAGVQSNYKTESALNVTAGVEAGFKLMLIRLGAEVGYFYAPMGELKTSTGTPVTNAAGGKVTFDMSGPYARVTAGFGL